MVKSKSQKKEIIYNIINSLLAGILVLLGSFTNGEISFKGFCVAGITSLIVIFSKFKEYWEGKKQNYSTKLFNFVQF